MLLHVSGNIKYVYLHMHTLMESKLVRNLRKTHAIHDEFADSQHSFI